MRRITAELAGLAERAAGAAERLLANAEHGMPTDGYPPPTRVHLAALIAGLYRTARPVALSVPVSFPQR